MLFYLNVLNNKVTKTYYEDAIYMQSNVVFNYSLSGIISSVKY